jgi:hypothetical protein
MQAKTSEIHDNHSNRVAAIFAPIRFSLQQERKGCLQKTNVLRQVQPGKQTKIEYFNSSLVRL